MRFSSFSHANAPFSHDRESFREIRNEARKGFSDLNANAAAATLPATRTNEPRSHVLLSTLFIRVTLLVEITYIYIPAYTMG